MYKIENKEKYYIYCRKRWKEIQSWKAIKYGERAKVIYAEEDTLDFICETFSDVLRYFANYYNRREFSFECFIPRINTMFDSYSYISMCYVVDQFNRIIYPSSYKYEIIKMIQKKDFKYKSNVFTKQTQPTWLQNRKSYFIHSYKFRKDPVPRTACKRSNGHIFHTTKVFTNNFEIDRDELDELNIDYYLPIQRKKESKTNYYYDWDGKMRKYSKSWKSNTKCRKQWEKHLK